MARFRVFVGCVAAALLATTVQFATTAPVAAAAPVTCVTSAKVFDGRRDGTLWYYEHFAPATGAVSWSGGRQIGVGFAGPTLAGRNGTVYYINQLGEIRWYRYDGSRWAPGSGKLIGTGFTEQYRNPEYATVDAAGRLFLLRQRFEGTTALGDARMFRYDEATGRWDDPAGTVVQVGWQNYNLVAAAGDNVVYTRDYDGNLFRHRYDPVSQRWTDRRRLVGAGWHVFQKIFSPGGDVLYAVNGSALYWYRFDADTGQWANGGGGRQIGIGWENRVGLSASTDSCATVARAVPPATPVPATSDDPVATVPGAGESHMFTLDSQGHVTVTTDAGSGPSTVTLPGPALRGRLSATPRHGGPQVVGLDSAGRVWHSTTDGTGWSAFRDLGGQFRSVRAARTTASELVLAAVDPEGRLWVRVELPGADLGWWHLPGPALTGEPEFASAADDVYGTALRRDGVMTQFVVHPNSFATDYRPEAAYYFQDLPALAGDEPVGVATARDGKTFFGHRGGNGAPVVAIWDRWYQMPDLAVASGQPLSAVQVGVRNTAVAALGVDGYVHVTSRRSAFWPEYQPWQRVGGPAATAPTLTFLLDLELTYRGQDGRLHRYTAQPESVGSPDPLRFSGGPLG